MIPILVKSAKTQKTEKCLLHIGYLVQNLDAGVDTRTLAADSCRRNHPEGASHIAIVDGLLHRTVAHVDKQWLSCALPSDENHAG